MARKDMKRKETEILRIAERFETEGMPKSAIPYGSGHINDTYLVECKTKEGNKRYILQRINHKIFKKPWELMENIVKVTEFLRDKIKEAGGDPDRETIYVVPLKEGGSYQKEEDGTYWRMYLFIEGAMTYDAVKEPKDFYESALAFGNFQKILEDYPAQTLFETIPNFHNTADRFAKFQKALEENVMKRADGVQKEIQFILDREKDCHIICDLLEAGEIPLRVTHNDTKLNNIMIDDETGKGICIIDLDTIMPGSALYDSGDSIRFGACTGAEDEKDLSKISCDMELFKLYTKGYIEGCGGSLTKTEIEMLPMGAKLMTLENGIRFLTDYLEGDVYFKIHRQEHNLDRARTQIKMVKDMEAKWRQMRKIVEEYAF